MLVIKKTNFQIVTCKNYQNFQIKIDNDENFCSKNFGKKKVKVKIVYLDYILWLRKFFVFNLFAYPYVYKISVNLLLVY